jgi:hypothetical protein
MFLEKKTVTCNRQHAEAKISFFYYGPNRIESNQNGDFLIRFGLCSIVAFYCFFTYRLKKFW